MAQRRRKPAEDDDDDNNDNEEEEELDELEAAEQSMRRASKKSKSSSDRTQSKSRSRKGKGKERERRRGDDDEEGEEDGNEEDGEPDENGDGVGDGEGAGKKAKAKAKTFTEGDISEKARELVRFAICNEGSKKLLKRDDINKKVMGPGQARNLDAVLKKANKYLRKTFGMQLVPLYPREMDDDDGADDVNNANGNNADEQDDEGEGSGDADGADDDDDDDQERRRKKKKRAAAAAKKRAAAAKAKAKTGGGAGAGSGPAKSFALRTLLPDALVRAAVAPAPFEPEVDARNVADLQAALGSGGAKRHEWKEWKMTRDEIVDWQTGPEQRTLMGILHIVLALIMVNERVLTDEQLTNHLKRIDLRLDTPLPLGPSAIRADKQTLSTFLATLSKQGYLEKTKLANPVAAAAGKGRSTQTQTQATQAQTQRGRQTQRNGGDNDDGPDGAPGGGGGGQSGNPNEEWRWGSKAYAEIGEQGMLEFIKDFYANLAGAGAGERGGGGRGTQGAGAGVGVGSKDPAKLEKEIIKGTTGGKQGAVLQVARDGERQDE